MLIEQRSDQSLLVVVVIFVMTEPKISIFSIAHLGCETLLIKNFYSVNNSFSTHKMRTNIGMNYTILPLSSNQSASFHKGRDRPFPRNNRIRRLLNQKYIRFLSL